MTENFTELAFTESVKAQQEKYGTRAAYSRMERGGNFATNSPGRNKNTFMTGTASIFPPWAKTAGLTCSSGAVPKVS